MLDPSGIGIFLGWIAKLGLAVFRELFRHPFAAIALIAVIYAPWIEWGWFERAMARANPISQGQRRAELVENLIVLAMAIAWLLNWLPWPLLLGVYLGIRVAAVRFRGEFGYTGILWDILQDLTIIGAAFTATYEISTNQNLVTNLFQFFTKFGQSFDAAWLTAFFNNVPLAALGSLMVMTAVVWPFVTTWRIARQHALNLVTGEQILMELIDNFIVAISLMGFFLSPNIPVVGWALALICLVGYIWWKIRYEGYMEATLPRIAFVPTYTLPNPEGEADVVTHGLPGTRRSRVIRGIIADQLFWGPLIAGASMIVDPRYMQAFATNLTVFIQNAIK